MNEVALENTDGLADTEITRLISLSNQASYSRSDIYLSVSQARLSLKALLK